MKCSQMFFSASIEYISPKLWQCIQVPTSEGINHSVTSVDFVDRKNIIEVKKYNWSHAGSVRLTWDCHGDEQLTPRLSRVQLVRYGNAARWTGECNSCPVLVMARGPWSSSRDGMARPCAASSVPR